MMQAARNRDGGTNAALKLCWNASISLVNIRTTDPFLCRVAESINITSEKYYLHFAPAVLGPVVGRFTLLGMHAVYTLFFSALISV